MASPQVDVDDIVSLLEQIRQRGHSAHSVFSDWVDLMLFALQRQDELYLGIVDNYREPADMDRGQGERSIDLFATAFGRLQVQMAETNADVVGAVYEEYGLSSDAFGQHFTPHSVCDTMAEISGAAGDDPDGIQSILDPACGSGRMLLTAAQRWPGAVFVGQDKDPICAKMAALNCCFMNLDAYIVQGDSLTLEYQRAWQTSFSPIGGSVRELDDDAVEELHQSVTEAYQQTEAETHTQQSTKDGEECQSVASELLTSQQASLVAFEGHDPS